MFNLGYITDWEAWMDETKAVELTKPSKPAPTAYAANLVSNTEINSA